MSYKLLDSIFQNYLSFPNSRFSQGEKKSIRAECYQKQRHKQKRNLFNEKRIEIGQIASGLLQEILFLIRLEIRKKRC